MCGDDPEVAAKLRIEERCQTVRVLSRNPEPRGEALVHCPSCDDMAVVTWRYDDVSGRWNEVQGFHELRLACGHCGHTRTAPRPRIYEKHWPSMSLETYDAGMPPFGARLWLEAECCGGHMLWALNREHLDYLAAYVAETQRERAFPSPSGNRQLAYKLPKWMKLAKNRDEIVRVIQRLGATL